MTDINPQLIPVRKDPEMIRVEILSNLIKMFLERGYISRDNIKTNINKIKKPESTDTYIINLDKPIKPEGTNVDKNFNGKTLAVRIVHQKITGITKIPVIKEFLDNFPLQHKVFIFTSISDKAKSTLMNVPNTEVFVESFLMINLVEHIDSPRYEVLSEEEIQELQQSYMLQKKEIPKILSSDPVVSYFNLKRGQVIRVIRSSEQSGFAVAYRIVIKG
jgi:DNA-directed RNA polymerase subunit H (RpoH/RPB5)